MCCFTLSISWMIAFSATGIKKKKKKPPRQATFSLACDTLHEPSILRTQPRVPPMLIHTLVTSCTTGSHAAWQAAWNSPGPVGSPSCTSAGTMGPAATPGVHVHCCQSKAQSHLRSKSGILKGAVPLAELSGDLQKYNEITKSLFRHLFIIPSPR